MLYEKNSNKKIYPASTTKLMTAVLILENINNIDTEIIKVEEYMLEYFKKLDYFYSNVELEVGEEILAIDLLYALLLPSGSDAANSFAGHIAGNIDDFVVMMNEKAQELGMTGTHYTTPHGLHEEDHYTTAYDIHLLTKHAMKLSYFMDIVTTSRYTYSTNFKKSYSVTSTVDIQNQSAHPSLYYAPIRGIKTGTTNEGGYCFVSSATKGDQSYLLVLMGAPIKDREGNPFPVKKSFSETKKIYEWAFNNFEIKHLIAKDEIVGEVDVRMAGQTKRIHLKTLEDLYQIIPEQYDEKSIIEKYTIPEYVNAPVKKGDIIGTLDLIMADETVGSVSLYAAEDATINPLSYTSRILKLSFSTVWFKLSIVLFVLGIVTFLYVITDRKKKEKRTRKKKHLQY